LPRHSFVAILLGLGCAVLFSACGTPGTGGPPATESPAVRAQSTGLLLQGRVTGEGRVNVTDISYGPGNPRYSLGGIRGGLDAGGVPFVEVEMDGTQADGLALRYRARWYDSLGNALDGPGPGAWERFELPAEGTAEFRVSAPDPTARNFLLEVARQP
jgi:hypothetical protein